MDTMLYEVINAGSPGKNTAALLQKLDADVICHKPDLTILLAGTNDALNSDALLPMEETCANISTIITRLQACGSNVLMVTPPPFHKPYLLARHPVAAYGMDGPEGRLSKLLAAIRRLCGTFSIPLVDINRVFSALGEIGESPSSLIRNKANSNSEDGIHPTPDGYRVIAACVHECILCNKLPRRRIVCLGDSITYGINVAGMGTVEGESYPARLNALLNGNGPR